MLHKSEKLFSFALLCIFLYPLIFQSIHASEHAHTAEEVHCCSHCSHSGGGSATPGDTSGSNGGYSEKQEECSICNFHYAKLQIYSSPGFFLAKEIYGVFDILSSHHPFILFQGQLIALRGPPAA
ncbi:MAG: DUF2946 family protein [Bacteroidota bacterium]